MSPSGNGLFDSRTEERIHLLGELMQEHCIFTASSMGKDSSVVLILVLEAARRLREEQKTIMPIRVLHANPLIDNPEMTNLVKESIDQITAFAKRYDLPVEMRLEIPSLNDQFFTSVIGGRRLPVFQTAHDCTIDLKIKPQNRLRKRILKEIESITDAEPITIIGTRFDESASRKTGMESRGETATDIWINEGDGGKMLSLIADYTDADVWKILNLARQKEVDSFSTFDDLFRIYQDGSTETTVVDNISVPKCRTGCFVCTAGKDHSLEAMLAASPRYSYMQGLNDLQHFLLDTQYDLQRRQWVSRSITEDGYFKIGPDTYGPEMLEELLRYCITLDVEEEERAREEGRSPAFVLIDNKTLIHIDTTWSLQRLHPAFHALKIYRDIRVNGERYPVPRLDKPFKKVKIPTTRYFYTGRVDEHPSLRLSGMRDIILEAINEDVDGGCLGTRVLKNGEIVIDSETDLAMDVNDEGAEFTLGEIDYLLEKYGDDKTQRSGAFHHYLQSGVLTLSNKQPSVINDTFKRTALKESFHLAGKNKLSLDEILDRSISAKEMEQEIARRRDASIKRIPWIEVSKHWIIGAQELEDGQWQFTAGPKENIDDLALKRLEYIGFIEDQHHLVAPMTWEVSDKLQMFPSAREIMVEAVPEKHPPVKINLNKYLSRDLTLPGDPQKDVYVAGISGGKDSVCLALILKNLFPDVDFKFCYTDTGAEHDELYETLDQLEHYLGEKIERITSEKGDFFDMLETNGHFLPSHKARWCTKDLKILPYQKWLHQFSENKKDPDQQIYSFVGIRADESERNGFQSNKSDIHTVMPLVDLGIDKATVFSILQDTLGVPSFYRHRTRSGCKLCPFMRRSEFLGLLRWDPKSFDDGIQYEVLGEQDHNRFKAVGKPIWEDIGWGSNWTTLPFPSSISLQAPSDSGVSKELAHLMNDPYDEPMVQVWFGAEFMVDTGMLMFDSGSDGIYWQEPVTFSSTRSGLARQLNLHAEHRLNTAQASTETDKSMMENLKLVAYCVEVPQRLVSLEKPGDESYTWNSLFSMLQLKSVYTNVLRTLHVKNLYSQLCQNQTVSEDDGWEYEHRQAIEQALLSVCLQEDAGLGRVVSMEEFIPKCFEVHDTVLAKNEESFGLQDELFEVHEYRQRPTLDIETEDDCPVYAPGM